MGFCLTINSKNRVANGDYGDARLNTAPSGYDPNNDENLYDAHYWYFSQTVDLSHFKLNKVIGVGSHGVIWLVDRRAQGLRKGEAGSQLAMIKDKDGNTRRDQYAMKIQSKQRLFMLRSIESVKMELILLSQIIHPFVIDLKYGFQDSQNLYMVTEYLRGGSLRYHMNKPRLTFSEKQAQFIIACVILALEFIHNNGIIHRDIRPENIMFDNEGFIKVIDFGLARLWQKSNFSDTSGHPGYIAPEVLMRESQGTAVDYFAVGVIAHELMKKRRPWPGEDRETYKNNVTSYQYSLKKADTPENWGHEASDFINKCIKRKTHQRLGLNGPQEMKNHIWFREFDWRALAHKKIKPPFVPPTRFENLSSKDIKEGLKLTNQIYNSNTLGIVKSMNMNQADFQEQFEDYNFNRDQQLEKRRNENLIN